MGAIALLMFVSGHDALTMAVLLVFAGGLTAYAASVLATVVMRDIDAVGDGVTAVGEGERDIRIATGGDDELAAPGGRGRGHGRPAGGDRARARGRRRGAA